MKKLLLLPIAVLIILSSTASPKKVYKGHCKGWGSAMLMAKHKSMAKYR